MTNLQQEIQQRLDDMGVQPLVGGLIPEPCAAELLGYAPSYLRRLAAAGMSPVGFVRRGNRRFYKLDDIRLFITKTVQ